MEVIGAEEKTEDLLLHVREKLRNLKLGGHNAKVFSFKYLFTVATQAECSLSAGLFFLFTIATQTKFNSMPIISLV